MYIKKGKKAKLNTIKNKNFIAYFVLYISFSFSVKYYTYRYISIEYP